MRRYLIPTLCYLALGVAYLANSGAPLRVHALSLAVLAVAILVPGIWAARLQFWRSRWLACFLCSLAAMLTWDATAHFVVLKAQPFMVLIHNPWVYLPGGLILTLLSLAISWVASPPDQRYGVAALQSSRPR